MPTPYLVTQTTTSNPFTVVWAGGIHRTVREFNLRPNPDADPPFVFATHWNAGTWLLALREAGVFIAAGAPGSDTFKAREITFQPDPEGLKVTATVPYTSMGRLADDTDPVTYQGPPLAEVTMSTAEREFERYRIGATVPTDGDASGTADMGGTKVDVNGQPFADVSRQQELQIETLWDASDCLPSFVDFVAFQNTRNNAAFLSYPIGSVLYLGPSFTPTHFGWYLLTHRFKYDETYHLVQRPKLDVDGRPFLDGAAGIVIGHALEVWWFQRYATKTDFSLLFTAEEWDYLNRTCPEGFRAAVRGGS